MSICCINIKKIDQYWITGSYYTQKNLLDAIDDSAVIWIPRQEAENDSSVRQIIPYVLVTNFQGHFACYQRKGSESRLHGLWSCGIGGHVEACDRRKTLKDTIEAGVLRELYEEFGGFKLNTVQNNVIGTIHEDQTQVGHHHIGIVYSVKISSERPLVPSAELHSFRWISSNDFKSYDFETWTTLALSLHLEGLCHLH